MASFFGCRGWRFGLAIALAAIPAALLAADGAKLMTRPAPPDPNATTIDMFDGIANGDIAVKIIPKDSKESRVFIENKTDKPLSVKLPDAFAGVPVLAQAAPGAPAGGGNNNQQQAVGGGGGMMGGGGGFMNIPPERIGQFKASTVCLDHGKAEPRPAVPYEIKPIETVVTNPEVQELCRLLAAGKVNQRAAQVAVWHFNNDMSWQQLAAKQLRYANGASEPYFTRQEVQAGMQLGVVATKLAEQRKQQKTSSDSNSSAK
jgi:hypothetical protein